jgi:hypothetical protein
MVSIQTKIMLPARFFVFLAMAMTTRVHAHRHESKSELTQPDWYQAAVNRHLTAEEITSQLLVRFGLINDEAAVDARAKLELYCDDSKKPHLTTGPLRHLQVLKHLHDREIRRARALAPAAASQKPSVLVLGAGLEYVQGHFVIPFLHELRASFNGPITVIDMEGALGQVIPLSYYPPEDIFQSKDEKTDEDSREMLDFIASFFKTIPGHLEGIDFQNESFEAAALTPEKYDYIFALHSIMYSLRSDKDPKQKEALCHKILASLKKRGILYTTESEIGACLKALGKKKPRIPSVIRAADRLYEITPIAAHKRFFAFKSLKLAPLPADAAAVRVLESLDDLEE